MSTTLTTGRKQPSGIFMSRDCVAPAVDGDNTYLVAAEKFVGTPSLVSGVINYSLTLSPIVANNKWKVYTPFTSKSTYVDPGTVTCMYPNNVNRSGSSNLINGNLIVNMASKPWTFLF